LRAPRWLFFTVFTVSGFSGLIYESIWSHYLKLLLGHAAYAQSIVLMTFMGGMALGAWITGRYSTRLSNLLRTYALVEALIGILALLFHPSFVKLTTLLHLQIIPSLESVEMIYLVKWSLSALIILPQSILLGATFPLMAAGVIRRFPTTSGASIASLYFCNSIGAAVGVLASGFWLINSVGLPGTIMTAGLLNLALALVVWLLSIDPDDTTSEQPLSATAGGASRQYLYGLLAVSFATGLASFIYEIGWIRMLGMVLGSATHSFELMLSAFILGLALGGLWIRRRIDNISNIPAYLAGVQLAMGALALLSLALYGQTFEVMSWLLSSIQTNERGYLLFVLASHGLSLLVMLPATFCAGMTLPLITQALLTNGQGERSIGTVYAANTVGAIIGVVFAIHIGMPMLGLKGLIVSGGAIDLALGGLIVLAVYRRPPLRFSIALALVTIILLVTMTSVRLDPLQMASGVYRDGRVSLSENSTVLFHRDGKTSTINVAQNSTGLITLRTNGKPDAGMVVTDDSEPTGDEATSVLLAAVPLALRPNARMVANIGMGSGFTTATFLASARIERADTVEIEAAVIEATKHFYPRVEPVYTDPRSNIVIEDAKTFFSARQLKYDILVSEPSNPWVSGVASLFSDEFYSTMRRHLASDGLFVQWIQIYEFDMDLLASIIKALSKTFADYEIYTTNGTDILIIASLNGEIGPIHASIFQEPEIAAALARLDIRDARGLSAMRIGGRKLLAPLFGSYGAPANSDFFPYLDLNAAKARFLKSTADDLIALTHGPLPIFPMLSKDSLASLSGDLPEDPFGTRDRFAVRAYAVQAFLRSGQWPRERVHLKETLADRARLVVAGRHHCQTDDQRSRWLPALYALSTATIAFLHPDDNQVLWNELREFECAIQLDEDQRDWFNLLEAVGTHDSKTMSVIATRLLLKSATTLSLQQRAYLLAAGMLAHLHRDTPEAAMKLWQQFKHPSWHPNSVDIHLRFLLANVVDAHARTR
jgi:spermidine synthase